MSTHMRNLFRRSSHLSSVIQITVHAGLRFSQWTRGTEHDDD